MIKLVEKYAATPVEELLFLFQPILQNTIRDFYRRQKIRSFYASLFSSFISARQEKENEDYDLLETLRLPGHSNSADPRENAEQSQLIRLPNG